MKKLIASSLAFAVMLTISACQSKNSGHAGHTPHVHSDGSTHYH
ncbi:MAG: hypothetical protein ACYC67_27215 [Prosthecobacter sp.]